MKELSSLDIKYVIRELKVLERSILDKVYQPEKGVILLQFHVAGVGKKLVKVISGKAMFLTAQKETPKNPSNFSMFLRKYLKQSKLVSIEQTGFERIVEFAFSNNHRLIVELFSKGNVIIVDADDKILYPLETQQWKDRIIKKGLVYKYPPVRADPFGGNIADLKEVYKKSKRESVVKKLAIDFSLGGKYAEEVCALAKVKKSQKRVDVEKLIKKINSIGKRAIKAYVYDEKEFAPFELITQEKLGAQNFNTFSEALDAYYGKHTEQAEEETSEKEKLLNLAEKQKQRIGELENISVDYKKIGDLIYHNYTAIEDLVKEIKKKKWDVKNKMIKELNKKERKVVIEL